MIPPQIPKRYAPRLTRRGVLVGLLLSLALVFGSPLRTVQASGAPGEPQALKTLNQSDDHGHDEGDDHEDVTPTPEPAHDDSDSHHDATPTPTPAHDDSDAHADATPTSVWDDGAQDAQPMLPIPTSAPVQTPTQQPHDDSDGHHATPVPTASHDNDDGHHGTPVPADSHGTSGDTHGSDGHDDGTTASHAEGEGHSEGEGEGHGRAVPPPDPTTKKIVLGSFAVFNLGVLIVAAVLKRRMPQRKPRPARPS